LFVKLYSYEKMKGTRDTKSEDKIEICQGCLKYIG